MQEKTENNGIQILWLGWKQMRVVDNLTWPDPFCAATYRLEIISATLQESGIVHEHKNFQHVIDANYLVD